MYKDFLGNEIKEGDFLVYLERVSRFHSQLNKGTVVRFTRCFVYLKDGTQISPEKCVVIKEREGLQDANK